MLSGSWVPLVFFFFPAPFLYPTSSSLKFTDVGEQFPSWPMPIAQTMPLEINDTGWTSEGARLVSQHDPPTPVATASPVPTCFADCRQLSNAPVPTWFIAPFWRRVTLVANMILSCDSLSPRDAHVFAKWCKPGPSKGQEFLPVLDFGTLRTFIEFLPVVARLPKFGYELHCERCPCSASKRDLRILNCFKFFPSIF